MKRRTFEITVAGLVIATAAICAVFILLGMRDRQYVMPLPPEPTASAETSGDASNRTAVVSVTVETVQDVIATLARPSIYVRDIMVERFWSDGSAITNLRVGVRNEVTMLRATTSGVEKNILVTPDVTYIWYGGDNNHYEYIGTETPDEFAMMVTYEDILALRTSDIQDASYAVTDGEPEIIVIYSDGELGYVTECRVSIELGLLVSAEIFDGDTLIYRMTAGVTSFEVPITQFRLPNGQYV